MASSNRDDRKRLGRASARASSEQSVQHNHCRELAKQEQAEPRCRPGRARRRGRRSRAKATVMQLVEEIGFDAVDAGIIEQSRRQQPGSPGYLKDCDVAGVRQALAETTEVRTLD